MGFLGKKKTRTVAVSDGDTGATRMSKQKIVATTPGGKNFFKEVYSKPKKTKGALSAGSLNSGGKRTSSGAKAPKVKSKSGADCFKGGKGCGPNK